MEIEGVVFKVLPAVRGTSAKGEWVRQEVIFDQPTDFNRKVCISFWGDKAQDAASYKEGEAMSLSVNVESREFNGKWYTSLQAWKVVRKSDQGAASASASASAPIADMPPISSEEPASYKEADADDLPF